MHQKHRCRRTVVKKSTVCVLAMVAAAMLTTSSSSAAAAPTANGGCHPKIVDHYQGRYTVFANGCAHNVKVGITFEYYGLGAPDPACRRTSIVDDQRQVVFGKEYDWAVRSARVYLC